MTTITPFLWFDDSAGEAVEFYSEVFGDAVVESLSHYPPGAPNAGQVMTATFTLAGQRLIALNGGPVYSFTPAISLFVSCADQDEVDRLWGALLDGGEASRCGWLRDRFGLSWQIIPEGLSELLGDADPARAGRAMESMLGMQKIDIAEMRRAADAAPSA